MRRLLFLLVLMTGFAGVALADETSVQLRGASLILSPTESGACVSQGELAAKVSALARQGIVVADVTCNGRWCGYGDNKVCCHSAYRYCCKWKNSNSYYCSNDACP